MSESKRALFAQFAAVAKALGHEYRLELLELVAQTEYSVEALADETALPVRTVSQHLQRLRQAGLVEARKEGKYVYYSVSDDEVLALLQSLNRVAERTMAEVRELANAYFDDESDLERISTDELLERMQAGMVTLIDVRPPEEFAEGHLPGAINVPLDELETRLKDLPHDREIVAYCRGPYCALSHEAVQRLHERGLIALRLTTGYPEWRVQGLPVEQGPASSG